MAVSGRLRVLSGLGPRAAACFLVETPGGRLIPLITDAETALQAAVP